MFNNLIESRSHTSELKRRGSFFLYTVAAYGLLFVGAGVGSIYAYDAQLDEQENEVVVMLSPVELPGPPKPLDSRPASAPRQPSREQPVDTRREMIASLNHPELATPPVSTKPNPFLPVRDNAITVMGPHDSNNDSGPRGPVGPPSIGTGRPLPTTIVVDAGVAPPPTPTPKPPVIVHNNRVMNSEALYLPKPIYTTIAKQVRASGTVSVQILIDETGKVISAHAVNGHQLLIAEAVRAAYQARFSPTTVGGTPVKVSGLINYNFVLQ